MKIKVRVIDNDDKRKREEILKEIVEVLEQEGKEKDKDTLLIVRLKDTSKRLFEAVVGERNLSKAIRCLIGQVVEGWLKNAVLSLIPEKREEIEKALRNKQKKKIEMMYDFLEDDLEGVKTIVEKIKDGGGE